jgi:hypothetical protein
MSNTNITTTTETTTVVVEENIVRIELNNIGVQGVPGANNDPVYVTVRNATGSLMTKGSIVYVSGGNGVHTQVSLALATSDATSARVLGWLADDIANNADGLCMVEGYLDGVDTQGVTQGVQLYLSGTTAGAFQVTKPVAPIHLVYVGVCVKSASGNGRVYVKVQNGYELDELHDVLIVSPQNNQVLAYDSATQLWKNAVNAPDGVTSITATAPLTGGTITSTGSIGLDQTALSITRSQVSDFTSGTVTSASTAQQAGTATYAVNSGTAVYATTSGTAVYSANSGTAVTISGSITKSQVSDFTSGTVAQADNATTSGTAVFATTAGTSTTISGDITRSQVSDFASGTVAQAGTATYAVNSGTAVYADTSGTATYATNSGTAVFATNASTAVSVSGSAITQSQVVNLVSDLANTAKLNTANTFTVGGHTVTSQTAGVVPLLLRGASGQTSDLFEIQNSGNVDLVSVNNFGSILFGLANGATSILSSNGRIGVQPNNAAIVPLTVVGAASQSADLLQVQNSAASNLVYVNSGGGLFATQGIRATNVSNLATSANSRMSMGNGGAVVDTSVAANIPLQVQNINASPTGDLTRWLSTASAVLSRITSTGSFYVNTNNNTSGIEFLATSGTSLITSNGNDLNVRPRFDLLFAPADSSGRLRPSNDNTSDLGIAANRWRNIWSSGLNVINSTAGNVVATVRGAASQSADLLQAQTSDGAIRAFISAFGLFATGSPAAILLNSGGGNSRVSVSTVSTLDTGITIRGVASQSAVLQSWQNSAGTQLASVSADGSASFSSGNALITASGIVRGVNLNTTNDRVTLVEESGGGRLRLSKATSIMSNPGADLAKIYLRDGTNAGTLKLVVRAGAAGAETTILDNIPQ